MRFKRWTGEALSTPGTELMLLLVAWTSTSRPPFALVWPVMFVLHICRFQIIPEKTSNFFEWTVTTMGTLFRSRSLQLLIWYIAATGKVTIERSSPGIITGTADVALVFW